MRSNFELFLLWYFYFFAKLLWSLLEEGNVKFIKKYIVILRNFRLFVASVILQLLYYISVVLWYYSNNVDLIRKYRSYYIMVSFKLIIKYSLYFTKYTFKKYFILSVSRYILWGMYITNYINLSKLILKNRKNILYFYIRIWNNVLLH